jgi:hypothetical protein
MNKTLPITLLLIFFLLVPSAVFAAPIQLQWNDNEEDDIAGYIVHYGTSSKHYEASVDVGYVTSYVLADLPEGVKHFIALTAYDTSGNESAYSKEITTQNCYFGITYMTVPPYVSYIFPCIDHTSYDKNFSLFKNDSRVIDQTGDYAQDGQQFSAVCEYGLKQFGLDITHAWQINGYGNASSGPLILGNFSLQIEGSDRKVQGIGFFLGIKTFK